LDAAVQPLSDRIREAFVEQPYELLEWGAPVPAACAPYRDAALAAGPGSDRAQLVAAMNRPGCSALYRFNRDPSTERLGVAVLVLVALVGIPLRHRLARSGHRVAAGVAAHLEAAQPGVRGPPRTTLPTIAAARPDAPSFLAPASGGDALASRVAAAVARERAA